jgi:hypothetical protein
MDISRLMPMDEEAVGLWQRQWAGARAIPIEEISMVDRLTDAPPPGVQPRLTAERVCQVLALPCEQPSAWICCCDLEAEYQPSNVPTPA